MSHLQICGESSSAPTDIVEDFRSNLQHTLEQYEPKDVFNADETAFYYRVLPKYTLESERHGASGCKVYKDRVTILVCASMLGEKVPPCVIGKYRKPRCFRNLPEASLPLPYYNSKNAWMTSGIFEAWLTWLNERMRKQQRHILLFVDNATCHKNMLEKSNIRLEYLPANCTSVVQPMDQGVIWSLKCKLRKAILEFAIRQVDNAVDFDIACNIDVLRAMQFIGKAWNDVHPDTVIGAFRHAGFGIQQFLPPEETTCDLIENFREYVQIDNTLFSQETAVVNIIAESDEVNFDWI